MCDIMLLNIKVCLLIILHRNNEWRSCTQSTACRNKLKSVSLVKKYADTFFKVCIHCHYIMAIAARDVVEKTSPSVFLMFKPACVASVSAGASCEFVVVGQALFLRRLVYK